MKSSPDLKSSPLKPINLEHLDLPKPQSSKQLPPLAPSIKPSTPNQLPDISEAISHDQEILQTTPSFSPLPPSITDFKTAPTPVQQADLLADLRHQTLSKDNSTSKGA